MPKHHFLKGKNVLFFSPIQIQEPLSGGQWRTFSLIQEARDLGAEVSVFSLTGRKKDYLAGMKSGVVAKNGFFEWVHRGRGVGLLQWASYRLELPPLWISLYLLLGKPKELKKLLNRADILVIDFPFGAPLLKNFKGFTVFSSHNSESSFCNNPLLKVLVQGIERQAVLSSDLTLHCSFKDRNALRALSAGRFVYRSNRTSKARFKALKSKEQLRTELKLPSKATLILFSGSAFAPNAEAVAYLRRACKEHDAWLEERGVKFLVVGTVTPPFRDRHILGTGPVETIEPYFGAVDAAINPVLTGSGSNVKIYEYKAAGIPILSTDFGVRGTAWKEGRDYHRFVREEFVESLENFLKRESKHEIPYNRSRSCGGRGMHVQTSKVD